MATNAILAAALDYAKRGWRVFPILAVMPNGGCECGNGECDKAGKHPAIPGWPRDATTDPKKCLEWWAARPDRGIGIATGEGSDITVLDVDGETGVTELGELAGGNGMPPTPTVQSRPGRYHYYFAYEKGIKSKSKALGSKLDTRNEGGYVVAPPSRHASGGLYSWLQPPSKVEVVAWPEFLNGEAKKTEKRGRPPKETFNPANPQEVAKLDDALPYVDPDDEEKWSQTGWILGRAFRRSDDGFAKYRAWAAGSRKFNAARTKAHYYEASKKKTSPIKTVASIYAWAMEAGWLPPNPQDREERALHVYANPFNERTTVNEIAAAAAAAPNVFAMGTRLIHVVRYGVTGVREIDIDRDPIGWVIADHNTNTLAVALGEVAAYWALRKTGEYERTDFSRPALATFCDCRSFLLLKQLRAFIAHPTLRADGTLITVTGYDAASRLYLTAEMPGLKVDSGLSQKAARAALETLMAPFDEYPWGSPTDRAVFLAALFTVGLRHLFDVVPLFAFSSPKYGSGKTKLCECISRLWFGVTLSKTTWTANSEEMEKRIAAFLLAGDRIVCLDNVEEGDRLEDTTLNKVLTSERSTFRILGKTERVELTNEATWFATGNQLRLSGDIARRALCCYVNPKMRDPSERRFKIPDLEGHVLEHREALMSAALSIVASWIAAGRPAGGEAHREYGSFENWYAMMRGVLLWVGEADIATAIDTVREADEEHAELGVFADALRRALPPPEEKNNTKTADEKRYGTQKILEMVRSDDALRAAFFGCVQQGRELNHRTLATLLRRIDNKVFLSNADPAQEFSIYKLPNEKRNGHIWVVEYLDEPEKRSAK